MSKSAKAAIFDRLRAAPQAQTSVACDFSIMTDVAETIQSSDKIACYRAVTEAVNTQVHEVTSETLWAAIAQTLSDKGAKTVLYGQETPISADVAALSDCDTIAYDGVYEDLKSTIFNIDAAITTSLGGIAQTGSVVLWPTDKEPRLMSLVPPVNLVILHENQLYGTFYEMLVGQKWQNSLPTNALLISGPSKTADIEQELCYGVHGPKELIVYVVKNDE